MGFNYRDIPQGMKFIDYLSQNNFGDALTKREIRSQLRQIFLDNPCGVDVQPGSPADCGGKKRAQVIPGDDDCHIGKLLYAADKTDPSGVKGEALCDDGQQSEGKQQGANDLMLHGQIDRTADADHKTRIHCFDE